MHYFDRNTDAARFPNDIAPLVDGLLSNRQVFSDDSEDPPYVTAALKYERARQQRRQTSPYRGDDAFVQDIIDIFGFDPLDFQVDSWQAVDRLERARRDDGQSKGAVLSAPTGFGKTEAFLGPLYQLQLAGRQSGAAIVYPSRALLQDQLGRILEHVHDINRTNDRSLSVGLYMGGQPWDMEQVEGSGFFERSGHGRPRFKLANCWCSEEGQPHAFECHATSQSYTLQCEYDDDHRFTDREVVLARRDLVFHNQPDILLTTLESLESFVHKPNYDLIDHLDTIVLDEVHLYTQLRGAHAAQIVSNATEISEDPLLWLGSSATIDNPKRFGRRIFGLSDGDIETLSPPDSDFDDEHDDHEHYYFMLSPEDGPGVSSMSIQQLMLLGHSLLQSPGGDRGKILSFIDSISQVNQKHVQFTNADRDRQLWQHHTDGDVEDWPAVAAAMDREFIDEPLDTMRVYSDEGFDSERAANSDLLLSTSFLEVGIDVGDINIVTQYRTPWNLSSFLQRAGRAAREPGTDSHIAVFLSNLTGDANMFYRADRFLGSSIRTPLKTDNPVVEWIHDTLRQYNARAQQIIDDRHRYPTGREQHKAFLNGYLLEDLGFPELFDMIVEPHSFFEDRFGPEVDMPSEPLLSEPVFAEAYDGIEQYLAARGEQFAEIEEYFDMDEGDIVRGSGAVDEYVIRVQDQVLDLVRSFRGQVTGYERVLERQDANNRAELIASIRETLEETQEAASELSEGTAQDKISHFANIMARLYGLTGELMQLRTAANSVTDGSVPQVNTDRLNETQQAVDQLDALGADDRLEQHYQRKKEAYYLKEALDELKEYLDTPTDPYKSLYSVKHLLRCAYYVNRYLETTGDQLTSQVWFVPPDYYGSSGQFMTVFPGDNQVGGTQESIDQLINTYTPYRSEYQSEAGIMQAFLPRTEVDDGEVQFDFSQHVTGREQDGILTPDELTLSKVEDLAAEDAQNILRYCPVCLAVLSDGDCLRHNESEIGKIHADSEVETTVADRRVDDWTGALALADLSAAVTLEGVTLEISPAQFLGPEIGYRLQSDTDRIEREISSPETPLGFQLNTRGIVFDMAPFLADLGEEVRERVALYKNLTDVDYEYLAYHTAAHFFLQLVADVSSVNTRNLLYGFDEDAQEVYVFERTEGGQGVVDLMYEEIATDPASVLEAINRIGYNPQVINERLWARTEFIDDLPTGRPTEEAVSTVVSDHIPVPYDDTQEQITQEVLSTMDRCRQFASDSPDLGIEDIYELKHAVAHEQIQGAEEYPKDAAAAVAGATVDHNRVKTLFYSPDTDSCVENLQLSECIAGPAQGDTLSYVLVEALRSHLTESVPTADAADAMFDHEHPPAAELHGTSVFLDF